MERQQLQHMVEEVYNNNPHIDVITIVNDDSNEISQEFAIPDFGVSKVFELSESCGNELRQLIEEYKNLFCTTPGKTTHGCHNILTKGPSICRSPRHIPGFYQDKVVCQLSSLSA